MDLSKEFAHRSLMAGVIINVLIFATLLYVITIHRLAVNQPAGDDYDAILFFLNNYSIAHPFDQLQLLLQQHNEHRIVFSRLITIFDLKIFGHINFVHLIWIGNFGWFLAIIGVWLFSRNYGVKAIEFSPAAILLLSFSHFDIMTWAMTSLSQYWQVCFGIFAIGLMVNNRFKRAQLCYMAALFTGGGGIALAPVFASYYFLQKKWHEFWINISFTVILILTYFVLLPYSRPSSGKILEALLHPQILVGYFFGFIGGMGSNLDLGIPSILTCGIILFSLFLAKYKQMYKLTPFLWWLVIYAFITAILAALNRSQLGIASSGDSRYSEYSLLVGASLYLAFLTTASQSSRKKMMWLGFILSIGIYAYWFEQSKQPLIDRNYWLVNGFKTHPDWLNALDIKKRSIELGIMNK